MTNLEPRPFHISTKVQVERIPYPEPLTVLGAQQDHRGDWMVSCRNGGRLLTHHWSDLVHALDGAPLGEYIPIPQPECSGDAFDAGASWATERANAFLRGEVEQ